MASIILTKADGTTDVTYSPQQSNGTQNVYQNTNAGLVEPETLRIQHFLRPAGAKGSDRHQIVLTKAIVEDTTNQYLQLSTSLQFSVPRSAEITLAMLKDMVAQLTSYINRSANLTALFNGATPEGDFNVTGPFNPTIA
jgi:hypothetical protein